MMILYLWANTTSINNWLIIFITALVPMTQLYVFDIIQKSYLNLLAEFLIETNLQV